MFYIKRLIILLIIGVLAFSVSCSKMKVFCGKEKNKSEKTEKKEAGRVLLRWTTESEEDNYGFNIYRSESPDGPWVKVNKSVKLGAGTTNIPTKYSYIDYPLEIGKTYYYKLEEVSYAGEKKSLDKVIPAVAKPLKEGELDKK